MNIWWNMMIHSSVMTDRARKVVLIARESEQCVVVSTRYMTSAEIGRTDGNRTRRCPNWTRLVSFVDNSSFIVHISHLNESFYHSSVVVWTINTGSFAATFLLSPVSVYSEIFGLFILVNIVHWISNETGLVPFWCVLIFVTAQQQREPSSFDWWQYLYVR